MIAPAVLFAAALAASQPAPPKFEIKDGDRIVWIGNTLVEREQRYGYWETALHAAFSDKQFTFRNLGWSGDTVFGDARASFDTPAKGFERLVSLTLELKPTVIFVSYGTNESFEGEAGLPKFEKGLEKLLDALKPANARVVLFTPLPVDTFEAPPGQPRPEERNKTLKAYTEAIRKAADQRHYQLADLNKFGEEWFKSVAGKLKDTSPLTENGMHLTDYGYLMMVGAFTQSLELRVHSEVAILRVRQLEPLRRVIVAKNELFFYRWRPQNETYLFGFRKHEQGKNAKEVAEFDPLVAKAEEEIERIRKELKK